MVVGLLAILKAGGAYVPLDPAYASDRLRGIVEDTRANRLAHYLQARGVGPDRLVALCAERGIEMVVGLLAILKAGGAYVPLDPSHPPERLRRMLDDIGRRVNRFR